MRHGAEILASSPRIDPDSQIEILPECRQQRIGSSGGCRMVSRAVSAKNSKAVSRLLLVSRQTLVQSRYETKTVGEDEDETFSKGSWLIDEEGDTAPLEADEVVLQHLHEIGDVDRCEFKLLSSLGASGESTANQKHRALHRRFKSVNGAVLPTTTTTANNATQASSRNTFLSAAIFDPARPSFRQTRLYAPLPGYMASRIRKVEDVPTGCRYAYDEHVESLWKKKTPAAAAADPDVERKGGEEGEVAEQLEEGALAAAPAGSLGASGADFAPSAEEDDALSPENQQRKLDRRGRGVGRADAKAKWRELENQALALLAKVKGEHSRNGHKRSPPTLDECLDVLRQAESLPQSFTEVYSQADCASLKSVLIAVRDEIDAVRSLSARARDCVCRGSSNVFAHAYNSLGVAYQGCKFHQRIADAVDDEREGLGGIDPVVDVAADMSMDDGDLPPPQDATDPIKDAEAIVQGLKSARVYDEASHLNLAAALKAGIAWNTRAKAICGTSAAARKKATSSGASTRAAAPTPLELAQIAATGSATPFADFELVSKAKALADWALAFDQDAKIALALHPRTSATYKELFDLRRKLSSKGHGRIVADTVALEYRDQLEDVCQRAETWVGDSKAIITEPRRAYLSTLRRLVRVGTELNADTALLEKLNLLVAQGVAWTREAAEALAHVENLDDDTLEDLHNKASKLAVPQVARRAVAKERDMRQWRVDARTLIAACLAAADEVEDDEIDAPLVMAPTVEDATTSRPGDGDPEAVDDNNEAAAAITPEAHQYNESSKTMNKAKKKKPRLPSMTKVRRHLELLDDDDEDDEEDDEVQPHVSKCERMDAEIDAPIAAIHAINAARALEPPSEEQVQLRAVLDEADAWATRAKLAAKSDGADASHSLLAQLIDEGRKLRVDASTLVKPLVSLQTRVDVWLETTKKTRDAVALVETTPAHLVPGTDENEEETEEEKQSSSNDLVNDKGPVNLDRVASTVAKAKRIAVAVDEIAQMRMFGSRTHSWRTHYKELCGSTNNGKSSSALATQQNSNETVSAAATVPSLKNSKPGKQAATLRSTTTESLTKLEGAFSVLAQFLDVDTERQAIVERGDAVRSSIAHATELVSTIGLSAAASAVAFGANPQLSDDSGERIDQLEAAIHENASSVASARLETSLRLARWCAHVRSLVSPLDGDPALRMSLNAAQIAACASERDAIMIDNVDEVNHKNVFVTWSRIFDEMSQRYGVLHSWQRRCSELAHSKKPTMDDLRTVIADAPPLGDGSANANTSGDDDLSVVKRRLQWLETAQHMLSSTGSNKISLRTIEQLYKQAPALRLSDSDDAKTLRAEARKAREWLAAVKRTGIERGEASIAELRKLISAVRSIRVNLSDDVNVLVQASRATCVCAAPADGQMLDCPSCKTSFHSKCIYFDGEPPQEIFIDSLQHLGDTTSQQNVCFNVTTAVGVAAAPSTSEAISALQQQQQNDPSANQQSKRRRSPTGSSLEQAGENGVAADAPASKKSRGSAGTAKEDRKRKNGSSAPLAKKRLDVDRCPRCQLRRRAGDEARTASELIKRIQREDDTQLSHSTPGSPSAAALVYASEAFGSPLESLAPANGDAVAAPAPPKVSNKGVDASNVQGYAGKLDDAAAEILRSAHQDDHARRRLAISLKRLAFAYRVGRLLQKAPRLSTIDALLRQSNDDSFEDIEFRRAITAHPAACAQKAHDLVKQLRTLANATTPRDPRTKAKKERRVDISKVKAILEQARRVPVRLGKLRRQCTAIIEDGGKRYCICRGPSDGSFMLGCELCDEWFHGRCVGVSEDQEEDYICDSCKLKQSQMKGAAAAVAAEKLGGETVTPKDTKMEDAQAAEGPSMGGVIAQPPTKRIAEVTSPAVEATPQTDAEAIVHASSDATTKPQPQIEVDTNTPAVPVQLAELPKQPLSAPAKVPMGLDIESPSDSSDNNNDATSELISEHPLPWPPSVLLRDDVALFSGQTKRLRLDASSDDMSFASRAHQLNTLLPSSMVSSGSPPAISPAAPPFMLDAHRQYMVSFPTSSPSGGQSMDSRMYESDIARVHMLAQPHVQSLTQFQAHMSPHDGSGRFVPGMSPMMSHMPISATPTLHQDLQQQQQLLFQQQMQHQQHVRQQQQLQQFIQQQQQQMQHHQQQHIQHQQQHMQLQHQSQQIQHQQQQHVQCQQQQQPLQPQHHRPGQIPPQLQLHPYHLQQPLSQHAQQHQSQASSQASQAHSTSRPSSPRLHLQQQTQLSPQPLSSPSHEELASQKETSAEAISTLLQNRGQLEALAPAAEQPLPEKPQNAMPSELPRSSTEVSKNLDDAAKPANSEGQSIEQETYAPLKTETQVKPPVKLSPSPQSSNPQILSQQRDASPPHSKKSGMHDNRLLEEKTDEAIIVGRPAEDSKEV